jgi:hypothetical protein
MTARAIFISLLAGVLIAADKPSVVELPSPFSCMRSEIPSSNIYDPLRDKGLIPAWFGTREIRNCSGDFYFDQPTKVYPPDKPR